MNKTYGNAYQNDQLDRQHMILNDNDRQKKLILFSLQFMLRLLYMCLTNNNLLGVHCSISLNTFFSLAQPKNYIHDKFKQNVQLKTQKSKMEKKSNPFGIS